MDLIMVAGPGAKVRLAGSMATPSVSLADIDWDRELAVVIDMGEQRTGGYGVSVTETRIAGPGRVELALDVRRPGPGAFVIQAFTHPYAVARVPKDGLGNGPVVLIAYDQEQTEVARRVVAL